MVLGKSGGVLPVMKKLVNSGLGGKMGNGKQFVSWIHEEDILKAILWLIENEKASGAYNLAAPQPVTNSDFMHLMRKTLGKKFGIPAAKWMLEIGAVFLRTETELILKSRKVVPKRLVDEGFVFSYSSMEKALKDLLK
jgi:NAD dependent epimerase/dehydratase family enzyme